MNIIIALYLFTSVSIASGLLDRNRVTNLLKEEIDYDEVCKSASNPPCVVKCCGDKEVLKLGNIDCVAVEVLDKLWKLQTNLRNELTNYTKLKIITTDGQPSTKTINDFGILYRKGLQKLLFEMNDYGIFYLEDVNLMENGDLEISEKTEEYQNKVYQSAPKYCFEYELFYNSTTKQVMDKLIYIVNFEDNTRSKQETAYHTYGRIVSIIFILVVLVVYGILKPLRSNLHGILLMAFLATHAAVLVSLQGTLMYEEAMLQNDNPVQKLAVCKWISPIRYFLTLSMFFWMNVMCFDIWWTFRYASSSFHLPTWLLTDSLIELDQLLLGTRKVRKIHRRGVNAKFVTYALYAWGVPLLVTVAAVVIDRSPVPPSVAKPIFHQCMHLQRWAKLYIYLPMLVLVSANVVLYIMTIYNIWAVKRHMVQADSSQNRKNKNQFVVYIKLAAIMGLCWIFEICQGLLEDDDIPPWLFYIMSVFYDYIGVVVFFVLVFKRSIFIMLCNRFGVENRWTRNNTNLTRARTDCSSSKSKSYAKTKSTDDSVDFESIAPNPDAMDNQNQQNPMFTITKPEAMHVENQNQQNPMFTTTKV